MLSTLCTQIRFDVGIGLGLGFGSRVHTSEAVHCPSSTVDHISHYHEILYARGVARRYNLYAGPGRLGQGWCVGYNYYWSRARVSGELGVQTCFMV